jgi:hypothetical protein
MSLPVRPATPELPVYPWKELLKSPATLTYCFHRRIFYESDIALQHVARFLKLVGSETMSKSRSSL